MIPSVRDKDISADYFCG